MINFVLRRLGQSAILLLIMSLLVFVGMYVVSDPVAVMAGEDATAADRLALAAAYGLDQPLPVQYARYMASVFQGDFGKSLGTGNSVAEDIRQRLPATLELATYGIVFGLLFGIPLGIVSALRRGRVTDHLLRVFNLGAQSIPASVAAA